MDRLDLPRSSERREERILYPMACIRHAPGFIAWKDSYCIWVDKTVDKDLLQARTKHSTDIAMQYIVLYFNLIYIATRTCKYDGSGTPRHQSADNM